MAKGVLRKLTITELATELRRRQKHLPVLNRKRHKLLEKLSQIDSQIAALGGQAQPARRGRKPGSRNGTTRRGRMNGTSLADVLAKALGKEPVSIGQAMEAAQKSGYESSSKQFRNIVNQTLSKDKRFKKVGRGQYALAA